MSIDTWRRWEKNPDLRHTLRTSRPSTSSNGLYRYEGTPHHGKRISAAPVVAVTDIDLDEE